MHARLTRSTDKYDHYIEFVSTPSVILFFHERAEPTTMVNRADMKLQLALSKPEVIMVLYTAMHDLWVNVSRSRSPHCDT